MIGNQIADRYQIEAELGSGGMGTVYHAIDTHTQIPVAIKHLKPEMANTDMIERFRREGETLRELNHPNMVKMLNALEENGHHYLVMEFVTGGDLKSLLQKGQLSIEQTLKIALDIADALTRAHKLNIIHRDLKPANVLIDDEGTARLTDFGIARVVNQDRITDTDAILGTIDYLAPEAFRDGDIDHRADIWAFGVMLFEMLTGDVPFQGDMIVQRIMAITIEAPPDLEALCPTAPISLIDLIYRMLEKDCNSRIVSMRHVGASLEDIMQGRSLHTPPKTRFLTPIPEKIKAHRHNLPTQTTAFIGRKKELDDLVKLVDDPNIRVVTLVAPGGMGKSRLVTEVAGCVLEKFEHGAYFVELAPLSDSATIPNAIAEAVGYQFQESGTEPKAQILKYLGNKKMLLILDNYEHLLDGASLVSDILASAPEIKVIVTSRESLNLSGESLYSLGGMIFPDWETPADALEYDAVKLFMQSATRIRPDFELRAEDLQYIARICRLTRGMPLGIVLAASWVKMLEPSEIAEELIQSADILESQMRDIPERQRSIRTIFDYSWNRLSEQEKSVFMKLSVFRGGFTRKAAQGVSGASLQTLMSLTNQSLIRRDNENGRYEVHELLRQYAEEQLENSGESESVRSAHMEYYADALNDIHDALWDGRQIVAVEDVEGDFENVRLAWERAVQQKNASFFDRALESVHRYCELRSRYKDGLAMIETAINAIESDTDNRDVYCRLLSRTRWSFGNVHDETTISSLQKGLDIARSLGLREIEARCLIMLSRTLIEVDPDDDDALRLNEEGLTIYREIGHQQGVADAIHLKGYIVAVVGDWETGFQLWQEEYIIADKLNNKHLMAEALHNLGVTHAITRNPDFVEAERIARLALAIQRQLGNQLRVARLLGNLGYCLRLQQKFDLCHQYFEESRHIFVELNETQAIAYVVLDLAVYDLFRGDYGMFKSRVEEVIVQIKDRDTNVFALLMQGWYHCIEGDIPIARDLFIRSLKNLNMYHLGAYTSAITCLAYVLPYSGQVERGIELIALGLNSPWSFPDVETTPLWEKWFEDVKEMLSQDVFESAWERGKTLDLATEFDKLRAEFMQED